MSKLKERDQMPGYAVHECEGVASVSAFEYSVELEGVGFVVVCEGDPKGVVMMVNEKDADPIPIQGVYVWGIPFKNVWLNWTATPGARIRVIAQLDGVFNLGPIDIFKDFQYEEFINLSAPGAWTLTSFANIEADRLTVQIVNRGGGALNYELQSSIGTDWAGTFTIDASGAVAMGTSETFVVDHAVRLFQINHQAVAGPFNIDLMVWAHKRR